MVTMESYECDIIIGKELYDYLEEFNDFFGQIFLKLRINKKKHIR